MIIPTLSEKQILSELIEDYNNWLIPEVQKIKRKLIKKLKQADLIKGTRCYEYIWISPNSNKWCVMLNINLQEKHQGVIHFHCIAESDYGTLDYYFLRGLTFGGEYYLKVTAHVIKRIKERLPKVSLFNSNQICSTIFLPHECGSAMKLTDLHFLRIVEESPDTKDVSLLVTTSLGVFIGEHTQGNNVIFKTFISTQMINREIEKDVHSYCLAGHIMQNISLYPQDAFPYALAKADEFRKKYNTCITGFSLDE